MKLAVFGCNCTMSREELAAPNLHVCRQAPIADMGRGFCSSIWRLAIGKGRLKFGKGRIWQGSKPSASL